MRASNAGHEVVFATTDRAIDDELAGLAAQRGLRIVRGSANDVRARFIDATADLAPEDIIVRLTADNLLPDGSLVQALIEEFTRTKPVIGSLGAPNRTLPYGLSAEAMTAANFRNSVTWRTDSVAQEHVTTALWDRQGSYVSAISHPLGDLGHLRCTVDTFDDYERLLRVFGKPGDPVRIPWQELVSRLASLDDAPRGLLPGPGFSLGTVQLGMPYGSVTTMDPPPPEEGLRMIRRAIDHGAHLDTARAYGRSEELIGEVLAERGSQCTPVVTKLDPLSTVQGDEAPELPVALAEASVFRSLAKLGRGSAPSMLLHRAAHRRAWGGGVWRTLQNLRAEGSISRLGVSVACPSELVEALDDPNVAIVQCARNLLDHRWENDQVHRALELRPDVEIEARSAFLQGVLLTEGPGWPQVPGVDPTQITTTLDLLVNELGRADRADLCIAWLRAPRATHSRVDRIVVGAQNTTQLETNLGYWSRPALTPDEVTMCVQTLPRVPDQLLDPAQWPRK